MAASRVVGVRSLFLCVFISSVAVDVVLVATADDVVFGCGGFLKSDFDKPIEFSRVEIKLYTKQGVLKYPTECAPNNGYYLIPVYDKGDYVLKVEPPKGWVFEPKSIDLHVDGISDACSQSRDINFQFKGFSVYGQLLSRGSAEGPSAVLVELVVASIDSDQPALHSVKTDPGGSFEFNVVPPGEYVVRAMGNDWSYDRQVGTVVVAGDNGRLEADLIVAGYHVSGRVVGDENEPILGVSFVLYGESVDSAVSPRGCESGLPKGFDSNTMISQEPLFPICYAVSTSDGRFNYASVTPGRYVIVPFYKGRNIKFDVAPARLEVIVKHNPLSLQQTFKVEGFSVSGRVTRSPGGEGVVGVTVLLDGKKVTITKKNGVFQLENIRAGSYKIQIIADNMQFTASTVKITPNSPNLPELVASSFQVCGLLEGDEATIRGHPMTITFTSVNDGSARKEIDSDNSGKFCIWLPSGDYEAKVESNAEPVVFTPAKIRVTVRDAPVSGVRFVQFKARVRGSVVCLEECVEDVQIVLRSLDVSSRESVRKSAISRDSSFEFDGVLPGEYEVGVTHDSWCWKETSRSVNVRDKDVGGVQFVQKGFLLTVIASHHTSLAYRVDGPPKVEGSSKATAFPNAGKRQKDGNETDVDKKSPQVKKEDTLNTGELPIVKGTNKLCLKWAGRYELRPVGCHIFGGDDHFVYDTSDPKHVVLEATRHLLSGTVLSDVDVNDVRIAVRVLSDLNNNDNGEEAVLGPFIAKRRVPQGDYEYSFTYWAVPQKVLEFTPQSVELLFYPEKRRMTTIDDCMPHATEFSGKKGLFLEGGITPALAGAKVTVVANDGSIEPIILETSADGRFRVGPLHDHTEYEAHAQKQGYVLTRNESNPLFFDAFKLAEISVTVTEDVSGRQLTGVLISLSGHSEYRRNSLTGDDGTMLFSELGPGQFFLRAMMKEFQFSPASKMVEVKEGATVIVALKGTRIAFSCYGAVRTLTGDPESGIVIEAVGQGECAGLQEEAKTETDGIYRVRGLKPSCVYVVRLKEASAGFNVHIERAAPISRHIEIVNGDVEGANFIAFRPVLRMDISGTVVVSGKHVGPLKVRLSRDDGVEQTYSLGEGDIFFHFLSLPMNGRQYTIALETASSSSPRSTYDFSSLPEVSFTANESYKHFQLEFAPKSRHGDGEIAQGSYLALPLAFLVLIAVYNHSRLVPKIQDLLARTPELVRRLLNPVAMRIREDAGGNNAGGGSANTTGGNIGSGSSGAGGGGGFMANLEASLSSTVLGSSSSSSAVGGSKKKVKPKKIQ